MSDEHALALAHQAGRELELTNKLFDGLRREILDRLIATSIDNPAHVALRERLFLKAQVIDDVRKALHEAVAAGEVVKFSRAHTGLVS